MIQSPEPCVSFFQVKPLSSALATFRLNPDGRADLLVWFCSSQSCSSFESGLESTVKLMCEKDPESSERAHY